MKEQIKLLVPFSVILFVMIGCGKNEQEGTISSSDSIDSAIKSSQSSTNKNSSSDPVASTIESALVSISGAADDANNEPLVAMNESTNNIFDYLLSSAYAASCSRSLINQGGGMCLRNVNCTSGPYSWSGTVYLEFSNGMSCSLLSVGQHYYRHVNFTRSGPYGQILTTSNVRNNYEWAYIGGGIKVEKIDAGYEMDILGQSKILTNQNGNKIFDVGNVTTSPIILNKLARNGRVISSGAVDVYHNMAKFKATHVFNNLRWSSSCCYPTGGSSKCANQNYFGKNLQQWHNQVFHLVLLKMKKALHLVGPTFLLTPVSPEKSALQVLPGVRSKTQRNSDCGFPMNGGISSELCHV